MRLLCRTSLTSFEPCLPWLIMPHHGLTPAVDVCCRGRSNVRGNTFTVLDAGHSVHARHRPPDVVSSQCELASIHYVRALLF